MLERRRRDPRSTPQGNGPFGKLLVKLVHWGRSTHHSTPFGELAPNLKSLSAALQFFVFCKKFICRVPNTKLFR